MWIHSFSRLIIEKFMKTIIAYRGIIDDVWRCLKMDIQL